MFPSSKPGHGRHRCSDWLVFSRDLAAGTSPDKECLESLRRRGFRAVVNLNAEGVAGAPLSPNVEATWAHAEALEHARLALYDFPSSRDVDAFVELYERMPKPLYVHSVDGASALTLARIAVFVSGGELDERVEQLLAPRLTEEWRRFAATEIATRSARPRVLTTRNE
ncbi:MAG: fused DSP-PTPase phosphatase/NAD kinase-like protein [Planctomycetota bacterium]